MSESTSITVLERLPGTSKNGHFRDQSLEAFDSSLRHIENGHTITEGKLAWIELPPDYVPDSVLLTKAQVVGRTTADRILSIENRKTTFRQYAAANHDRRTLIIATSFPSPALRTLLDKLPPELPPLPLPSPVVSPLSAFA